MTCDCVSAGILVPIGNGYVPHTYDDLPAILPAESEGGGGTAAPMEATIVPAPASEATTLDVLRTWLGGFGEELWSGIEAGRNAATSLELAPWLLGVATVLLLLREEIYDIATDLASNPRHIVCCLTKSRLSPPTSVLEFQQHHREVNFGNSPSAQFRQP